MCIVLSTSTEIWWDNSASLSCVPPLARLGQEVGGTDEWGVGHFAVVHCMSYVAYLGRYLGYLLILPGSKRGTQ